MLIGIIYLFILKEKSWPFAICLGHWFKIVILKTIFSKVNFIIWKYCRL